MIDMDEAMAETEKLENSCSAVRKTSLQYYYFYYAGRIIMQISI